MSRTCKPAAPRRPPRKTNGFRCNSGLTWMNHSRALGHRKNKQLRTRAERRTEKLAIGDGRMKTVEGHDET